jgi:hypothetical protein
MNEIQVLRDLTTDLQLAPAQQVIYLEGKTDIPIFFALLGLSSPRAEIHQGVLVRGLERKSGAAAVRSYVEVAARSGPAYAGIRGITDGDGESFSVLSANFAPPFAGPCFRWPAYCIENMMVKTGWPTAWGAQPDWMQVLLDHVPYVALNRLHRELIQTLTTLRLAKYTRPELHEPMKTVREVADALAQDKHLIEGYDVEARFHHEVVAVEDHIRASIHEGHAVVNGKWLVDVVAPRRLGASATPQRCREEWIAHAIRAGGMPEVRDLWQRITGHAP